MSAQELIDQITSLQNLETQLYQNLVSANTNTNNSDNTDTPNDLVNRITTTTNSKNQLLAQLQTIINNLSSNDSLTAEQKSAIMNNYNVVTNTESQLSQQNLAINRDKNLNVNNLRLTEINTYYSHQYRAKANILKIVSIACLPIILAGIFKHRYLISERTASSLVSLTIIIALIFIIPAILDISMRDNMDYNQYAFPFDYNSKSNPDIGPGSASSTKSNSLVPECVGSECCTSDLMSYDKTTKKCVEGFSNSCLAGQSTQIPNYSLNTINDINMVMSNPSGEFYAAP